MREITVTIIPLLAPTIMVAAAMALAVTLYCYMLRRRRPRMDTQPKVPEKLPIEIQLTVMPGDRRPIVKVTCPGVLQYGQSGQPEIHGVVRLQQIVDAMVATYKK